MAGQTSVLPVAGIVSEWCLPGQECGVDHDIRLGAGFPLTLEIASVARPKPTWVKISQIRTLSVERLGKRMGRISGDEMAQIVEGLHEIIGEQSAAGYGR